jgi:hypothetical protein
LRLHVVGIEGRRGIQLAAELMREKDQSKRAGVLRFDTNSFSELTMVFATLPSSATAFSASDLGEASSPNT